MQIMTVFTDFIEGYSLWKSQVISGRYHGLPPISVRQKVQTAFKRCCAIKKILTPALYLLATEKWVYLVRPDDHIKPN